MREGIKSNLNLTNHLSKWSNPSHWALAKWLEAYCDIAIQDLASLGCYDMSQDNYNEIFII